MATDIATTEAGAIMTGNYERKAMRANENVIFIIKKRETDEMIEGKKERVEKSCSFWGICD